MREGAADQIYPRARYSILCSGREVRLDSSDQKTIPEAITNEMGDPHGSSCADDANVLDCGKRLHSRNAQIEDRVGLAQFPLFLSLLFCHFRS